MHASYCDGYYVPPPDGSPFPMGKVPALHRLRLPKGLHARNRFVLRQRRAPPKSFECVLLLSGGYAETPEQTADLYAITHREAARVYDGATTAST